MKKEKIMLWGARISWPLGAIMFAALAVAGVAALSGSISAPGPKWGWVAGTISWTGSALGLAYVSVKSWRWR